MNPESKWLAWFYDTLEKIRDWLEQQEWYNEANEKWEALDSQSRNLIKLGSGSIGGLFLVYFLFQTAAGVYNTRAELEEKMDLLNMIQSANNELSVIKGDSKGTTSQPDQPINWESYFSEKASLAGIDATRLKIERGSLKSKDGDDLAEEATFNIVMQQINVKQLIRFSFYLESGSEPVKVRTFEVETEGAEGYLNARVLVSSFQVVNEES